MIVNFDYRELDPNGERMFTVSESVAVPLLTMDEKIAGAERIFKKGGTFIGVPVQARYMIKDNGIFVPAGSSFGFLVEDGKNGAYIVPMELVMVDDAPKKPVNVKSNTVQELEHSSEISEEIYNTGAHDFGIRIEDGQITQEGLGQAIEEVADDVVETTEDIATTTLDEIKKFDPKETLGFSYKQLAVIGIVGLVLIKILK
jgi:hypothetical protein